MNCFYINLQNQTTRRAGVEQSFRSNMPQGWSLHRISALTPETMDTGGIQSRLRPVEQACYLSHIKAISQSIEHPGMSMICEDDVLFGKSSGKILNAILSAGKNDEWDLLFPEIGMASPMLMIQLFMLKKALDARKQIQLFDLQQYPFFSATCYIVNERFKTRLIDKLNQESLSQPYDMILRKLVLSKQIRAKFVFPFATSISDHAAQTQVQSAGTEIADLIWNEFRKLMWCDYESSILNPELPKIAESMKHKETEHFSRILEIALSPSFKSK